MTNDFHIHDFGVAHTHDGTFAISFFEAVYRHLEGLEFSLPVLAVDWLHELD